MALVELFKDTLYSVPSSLVVPEGKIKLCAFTALTTSAGAKPRAWSCRVSISTETNLILPPDG